MTVNAKSIMGVMAFPLDGGEIVHIKSDGIGEVEAVKTLKKVLE